VVTLRVEGERGILSVVNPLVPQRGHLLMLETGDETRSETFDGPSTYSAQLSAVRATLLDGQPFHNPADDFICSMEAVERIRAEMPKARQPAIVPPR